MNQVGSIVITNPGRGYTSPPTITIPPPGAVDTVTVTHGGSGYHDGLASDPNGPAFLVTSVAHTSPADVHVTVSGGVVQNITRITNRGSGYQGTQSFMQPIVISPGSGGEATVTLVPAATATSTLFGTQGPSLPMGTEPTNPPNFPFITGIVEFTVTSGANTVDLQTVDGFTLPIVVQPNQPPVIQAPLTFAVTLNQATPLLWPASMTPFADASAESLTVTLAVPTGVLAAASSGGVTVSGATDIEKQFVGSVAALNAYFKAANITYTATGTTSQSRPLTITATDGAAHSEATSTIVVSDPNPNGPPTINSTTVLEWATENQWFENTYDQLVAASGATDPAHRTVEFTLAAINSGTLQMNWHGIWIPAPTPKFGQAPPFLMQGGKIRWLPPANTVNASGQLAFTVGLFDLSKRSLGTSQVFIKIRA